MAKEHRKCTPQGPAFQHAQWGKEGQRLGDRRSNGEQAAEEESATILKGVAILGTRGQSETALGGLGGAAGRILRLFTLHPSPLPCQVFTRYGKCYTFNSGRDGRPRLKTMKGGTGNGLEIMLDIQQDEYLPVWGETGMSPLSGAPSPWLWASASTRGLLGSTVGPEAGLGRSSFPPSISPSPSPILPDEHTHISLAPHPWLSYSPR